MDMSSATYPTLKNTCSCIDITHFAMSWDSVIFEFSKDSKFSISLEKSDSEAKLIPKIRQTSSLIMCCRRLMYCYCTDQI